MPLLPTTNVFVTDHALDRWRERLGEPIPPRLLAARAKAAAPISRRLRQRLKCPAVRCYREKGWVGGVIHADAEAVYYLSFNERRRGEAWLITVLSVKQLTKKGVSV